MKNTILTAIFLFASAATLLAQTSTKLNGSVISSNNNSDGYNYNQGTDYNGNMAANCFDGNLNTFFASSIDESAANTGTKGSRGSKGGWVGLDLGSKNIITSVKYAPRTDSPGPERVECAVIEGANSPDFMDAVAIGIISEPGTANEFSTLNINSTRGFRYVRYYGSLQYRANIAELEFYGYAGEGNDTHIGQLTNLPTVNIHTEDETFIADKENYINATITIVNGSYIKTETMEIRGRGNASWEFKKRPYRMKFESSTRLFNDPINFPANAKNWTLISNEGDKTLIRNLVAFNISKRFEMPYTPAGRSVDVVLNGDYKGCYQLCDHIDVRPGRVDVTEMSESDITGDALKGGYLLEIDAYLEREPDYMQEGFNGFLSNRNVPVGIKSPDYGVSEQINYAKNQFNTWESAVINNNNYLQYMDIETFCRHFLIGEFAGNTDTYWSVYMYKQQNDDKFYFAPIWDFDIAFENDHRIFPTNENATQTGQWLYHGGPGYTPMCDYCGNYWQGNDAPNTDPLIDKLISYPEIYQKIKDIWAYYRDNGKITTDALNHFIDSCAASINISQDLNFKRWDNLYNWEHMMEGRGDYANNIKIVKDYLTERLAWIDNKLQYVPSETMNNELKNILVYANDDILYIKNINQQTQVSCFDIAGKTIFQTEISVNFTKVLPAGTYIVQLATYNDTRQVKVIIM